MNVCHIPQRIIVIFFFLLVSYMGQAKTALYVTKLIELKQAPEDSRIIVKSEIDLKGELVILPANSIISFLAVGSLSNGSLSGNNTIIQLSKGSLGNVEVLSGIKSDSKTILTSSLSVWTPSSLISLVNLCKEGATIVFDADYDYTIDRVVRPIVSIKIDGKGKQLTTINKYNYVISLFDIRSVDYFELTNLVIDGNSNHKVVDGTIPKEFFMTIIDVPRVIIHNCILQNIFTAYPNWKVGDNPYTIWVENYNRFDFTNNKVVNCRCPEFIKAVLPINNTNPNRIATIANNEMYFYYTSSAVEVRFGRYKINNNVFGITNGSTINAFGFDSEIIGNTFYGAHNSASIDLSEYFFFKYVSHGIKVKNNKSNYSRDGFLIADNVHDIEIKNNVFRADVIDEAEHARFDKLIQDTIETKCDRAISLGHTISRINIISNEFVGANALMMLNQEGKKSDIRVENNIIRNVENPTRSSLIINQIDGMVIKKNIFVNTGQTFSQLGVPQFIAIGPTNTSDSSERYVNNLVISNNSFSFSNPTKQDAYVLAHTIYDKRKCNTLSTLGNIEVKSNSTSFNGNILLVSDIFVQPAKTSISVKRNRFKDGMISGNVFPYTYIINASGRSQRLEPNTIVRKNSKSYYVIIGGTTSKEEVNYNSATYIVDGNAILKEIQVLND